RQPRSGPEKGSGAGRSGRGLPRRGSVRDAVTERECRGPKSPRRALMGAPISASARKPEQPAFSSSARHPLGDAPGAETGGGDDHAPARGFARGNAEARVDESSCRPGAVQRPNPATVLSVKTFDRDSVVVRASDG